MMMIIFFTLITNHPFPSAFTRTTKANMAHRTTSPTDKFNSLFVRNNGNQFEGKQVQLRSQHHFHYERFRAKQAISLYFFLATLFFYSSAVVSQVQFNDDASTHIQSTNCHNFYSFKIKVMFFFCCQCWFFLSLSFVWSAKKEEQKKESSARYILAAGNWQQEEERLHFFLLLSST